MLSFGLPDDAQAQFICPNGPGLGEFLVNQIQGHPEEPPLYLCMGSGDTGSSVAPPRPPIEIQPSYLAVARGEDGSIWVSVGHRTVESAKRRVLNACAAAQRRECYVSDTHFDEGFVYVAEDAMGLLWTKIKPLDRKNPHRFSELDWNVAIEHCYKNPFGCRFAGRFQSGLIPLNDNPKKEYYEDYFPKGKMELQRWALVARPTQPAATPGRSKSWLISGKDNSGAARKEVLDRCQKQSGLPCTIAAYAVNSNEMVAFSGGPKKVNGLLVHFVDSRGRNRWTSAVPDNAEYQKHKGKRKKYIDPMTVKQRVDRLCPKGLPCKVIATYDAATPRMQVIEDAK